MKVIRRNRGSNARGGVSDGTREARHALSRLKGTRAEAAVARMRTVVSTLDGVPAAESVALARQLSTLLADAEPDRLWLARSVLGATLPDSDEMASLLRTARLHGPWAALAPVLEGIVEEPRPARVLVASRGVTCDIHSTAESDFISGIQRVVRATVERWATVHDVQFVGWTPAMDALRPLGGQAYERIFGHGGLDGPAAMHDVVVPWHGTHVIPELAADPDRTSRIHALGKYSGCRVGSIGYDCIPMTTASSVAPGMVGAFGLYLASSRYAHRIAAISDAAAGEYAGWKQMLAGVRGQGPEIKAVTLPVTAVEPTEEDLARARRRLGITSAPMVLVVGSHEPRKNHLAVLHAAESLWREGLHFTLVIAGAGSWRARAYYEGVEELRRAGRPIQSISGLSDELLWAGYRLAHCTLFPSLNEGFGLPVAESLAAGTPVITSNFGSTRDIVSPDGVPLGGLLVDPRDDDDITSALRTMLTDREVYGRLKSETSQHQHGDWDTYAKGVWDFLVGDGQ